MPPIITKGKLGYLQISQRKKLIDMMVQHEVEYIDIPLTESRGMEQANYANIIVKEVGDCLCISFDPEQQR